MTIDKFTLETTTSKLAMTVEGDSTEVILLLHGGPGVPDYLEEVSRMLTPQFKTVRFDQRGVGQSKAINNQYSMKDYISDIDAVIDFLNVDKVHVFGHSWGGLLALIYTSSRPKRVKSLFQCSPSSGTGTIWQLMEREVMEHNRSQCSNIEWLRLGLNSLFGALGHNSSYQRVFAQVWKNYFKKPSEAPEVDTEWLKGVRSAAINKTRKEVLKLNYNDIVQKIINMTIPFMITYGAYDIYGKTRKDNIERLANGEYYEFSNAGHLPWIQDPEDFKKLIGRFYK
ncbi:alpha/beta fold hydrolase [Spirochaeta cellobiosiphila]|uniref:alpha/beta fold hydrolase n=1 Tax=Spirochaeta cellobiosiphila TaxID=504483 RepID=UPI000412832C|nr:alpha/beta hydrolase [Spirochaeta cellobiosiphila]